MTKLGVISVMMCLCGFILAISDSELWVAPVCIGLMLSTVENYRIYNARSNSDDKTTQEEQEALSAYRKSAIHFLTTFQSVDGSLPMTREEAERHLDSRM